MFKKELEKDISGDTSGNFEKLLLALVQVPQNQDWDSGPGVHVYQQVSLCSVFTHQVLSGDHYDSVNG